MTKPSKLCLRAVDFDYQTPPGDGRTLEGYAAVFGADTEINSWEGQFVERIAPGAFAKTLSERMPVLQFDHGHDSRTGSIPIGAIKQLREDEKGLYVQARLFENPLVEPIRQAIEGGAISGMSFRFKVVRDEWRDGEGKQLRDNEMHLLYSPGKRGPIQRTIKEVQLFEAGPVVFPAYNDTSVGVRSVSDEDREALIEEYRQSAVLDKLVEGGMSSVEALRAVEGHCVKRGARCNCHKCPGSAAAPMGVWPDMPPCDACEDERAMTVDQAPAGQKVKKKTKDSGGDKEPYGDVDYADPGYQSDGKKRYPIDTKEHVKAAWSYINQEGNASKYTPEQVSKIKSKIKAAAAKFGVEISDDSEKSVTPDAEDAALAGTSEAAEETPEDAVREDTSSGREEIDPAAYRARKMLLMRRRKV